MEEEPNTNNFYGYFPGGYKRDLQGTEKIIADLDGIIEKTDFDVVKFESLRDAYLHYQQMNVSAGSDEMSKMAAETRKQIEKMVYPLFEAMLELGYDKQELIS